MATIGNDAGGHKRILFVAGDGKRKTIRLGKVSAKQANAFKVKLESLVGQTITGVVNDEVSRWLADLDDQTQAQAGCGRLGDAAGNDGTVDGGRVHGELACRQARRRLQARFAAGMGTDGRGVDEAVRRAGTVFHHARRWRSVSSGDASPRAARGNGASAVGARPANAGGCRPVRTPGGQSLASCPRACGRHERAAGLRSHRGH